MANLDSTFEKSFKHDEPPEVPWDDHPLLDPLSIADGLLVGLINPRLDPPHHCHIWTLKHLPGHAFINFKKT